MSASITKEKLDAFRGGARMADELERCATQLREFHKALIWELARSKGLQEEITQLRREKEEQTAALNARLAQSLQNEEALKKKCRISENEKQAEQERGLKLAHLYEQEKATANAIAIERDSLKNKANLLENELAKEKSRANSEIEQLTAELDAYREEMGKFAGAFERVREQWSSERDKMALEFNQEAVSLIAELKSAQQNSVDLQAKLAQIDKLSGIRSSLQEEREKRMQLEEKIRQEMAQIESLGAYHPQRARLMQDLMAIREESGIVQNKVRSSDQALRNALESAKGRLNHD